MPGIHRTAALAVFLAVLTTGQNAENATPAPAQPFPPPATKLEAFQPPTDAVYTVAREDLGNINGVAVEVREMRDARGKPVRGLVVEIPGPEGSRRSYVDADELAALIRGCDSLLALDSNPTPFKTYEARISTRGSLQLAASTSEDKGVTYSVTVGRFRTASRMSLTAEQMNQLRGMFASAAEKIAALPD